jgi:ATP-binding cassette subfamily C protein
MRKPNARPNILHQGFRAASGAVATAIFFSLFINLLIFAGPLYMLQIYDRVLTSKNEFTLVFLTLLVAFLFLVYALLENVRSAVLVRAGLLFDSKTRAELFETAVRGTLKQPGVAHYSVLREIDVIREFLTGSGLIAFCDVPWVPIFVAGCFILHPWFGWMALGGAIIIFCLAVANEMLTRRNLTEAGRNAGQAGVFAAATFRNVEVLQAMGMWRPLRDRWLGRQKHVLNLQARASDRAGMLVALTKFVRMFLQSAILGMGAYLAIHNESSAGSMIAASIIMGRALAPVELVVSQWKTFLNARNAYARISELLNVAPPEPERMKLPTPGSCVRAGYHRRSAGRGTTRSQRHLLQPRSRIDAGNHWAERRRQDHACAGHRRSLAYPPRRHPHRRRRIDPLEHRAAGQPHRLFAAGRRTVFRDGR